ncbi:MAG TPA: metalloregulator ArsR/SmtB family transcription factor [Candidatus Dormibacteraeota bacterium]|jgi:ArsR family transcriptional regulator|nr:metalloregulator ArsR/SmtB family transcription factor [Candidatus Dormibacteraeota bacterium]
MDPGRRPPRLGTPRRLVTPPTELSVHFEGLAHPTRLTIIERLASAAEVRVSELAEFCKVSQPRMSWHLRILRRSQVIRTRREGREVFCRLDREAITAHMRSFMRLMLAKGDGEPSPDLTASLLSGEAVQ